jgi:hypothetical protein
VAPAFEAGDVILPDPTIAPWVHDYIEELCTFPRGAHDDQCDATSQAITRLNTDYGGMLEWMRQEAERIEKEERGEVSAWSRLDIPKPPSRPWEVWR